MRRVADDFLSGSSVRDLQPHICLNKWVAVSLDGLDLLIPLNLPLGGRVLFGNQ